MACYFVECINVQQHIILIKMDCLHRGYQVPNANHLSRSSGQQGWRWNVYHLSTSNIKSDNFHTIVVSDMVCCTLLSFVINLEDPPVWKEQKLYSINSKSKLLLPLLLLLAKFATMSDQGTDFVHVGLQNPIDLYIIVYTLWPLTLAVLIVCFAP